MINSWCGFVLVLVNIEFKMLYCFACKDYVYHKDVDSIRCQLLGACSILCSRSFVR